MKNCLRVVVVMAVTSAGFVSAGNTAPAAKVKLNGQVFTLPDGLELELVAGPPLVNRPICADFDDQGRLYVADSSGSNEDVQVQVVKRPHRIVRLEDTDGDGRFDKSVVFADRMMFPEGAMWYAGSLFVAAPPQIWKLTDADDDGVAERREAWFDGKTLTHCGNDLHGPYLGPDGWIYWCKGAFAEQTYNRPGRQPLVTRAAHIFRRHPDGQQIESVMTGGMDNPVELVFMPGGERIFTTTFLVHPGGGLRDGLIHAIYGGVYGKVHGVLDGHPRTGPIMPVLDHLGAAAPCGLVRLETDQLGTGYRNNLLACLFNMHKITRHVLTPKGSSFESQHDDFLVSDSLDFHPTDVLEDADGSLVVIDTGGWYKMCCPTSQLSKPDVLGAIYRLRRPAARRPDDPRGTRIDFSAQTDRQLADLLADARFAVRGRARQLLGDRGAKVVGVLRGVLETSASTEQRLQTVWALTRIDDARARRVVRGALSDRDETVRQAALHSISVHRDRAAEMKLVEMLQNRAPQNRRAAAEALGRIGSPHAVAALLTATADASDRALEHSLTYAVVEIAAPKWTRLALGHENPLVHRAAMIALDQMAGGDLQVADVRPVLDSGDRLLRDAAWWIAQQHPEWAAALAPCFRAAIQTGTSPDEPLERWSARLARFAHDGAVQQVMAEGLAGSPAGQAVQRAILEAMIGSGLKAMPAAWSEPLSELLATTDVELLGTVVRAVRALSADKLTEPFVTRLRAIAGAEQLPASVRLQALVALPGAARPMAASTLRFLCDHLAVEQPVGQRALAVDVLTGTPLDTAQLLIVADALAGTGPMELGRLLETFAKASDPQVGLRLVRALERSPAASSLPVEKLKQQLSGYGAALLKEAEPLVAKIEQDSRDKMRQLESVLTLLDNGDVRRGQLVFHSTKTACVSCHAMGYLGGRIGPDLTRIGAIRSERDLLEAILFPSASLVRSYEPTIILTVDGQVINGVVREETATEVTLQVDAEKVVGIAVDDIDERKPGTVSIMPAGLDKQVTPAELADLVTFLKAAK